MTDAWAPLVSEGKGRARLSAKEEESEHDPGQLAAGPRQSGARERNAAYGAGLEGGLCAQWLASWATELEQTGCTWAYPPGPRDGKGGSGPDSIERGELFFVCCCFFFYSKAYFETNLKTIFKAI
jgi:hypothetical protein